MKKKKDIDKKIKKVTTVIPAGKQQETGFTRFIKVSKDNPEVIKDARLNQEDDNDTKTDAEKI